MIRIKELSICAINRALNRLSNRISSLIVKVKAVEDTQVTLPQVGNRLFLFYNFS
jgi:hypothetical protein